MDDLNRTIQPSKLFVVTIKAVMAVGYSYANVPERDRLVIYRPDGAELCTFPRAAWSSDSAAVKLAYLAGIVGIVPAEESAEVGVLED